MVAGTNSTPRIAARGYAPSCDVVHGAGHEWWPGARRIGLNFDIRSQ